MLKPLAEVVEPGADFFVEDIALTAIVFDTNDDDVTLWVTTFFDEELHFFHLAATFADLSTLLRLAGERGAEIDLEVADALSGTDSSADSEDEQSADAEELDEQDFDVDEDKEDTGAGAESDEDEESSEGEDDEMVYPTVLEFVTEERPPVLLPGIALKVAFTYTDETDTEAAFNIFALEGIYLHIT